MNQKQLSKTRRIAQAVNLACEEFDLAYITKHEIQNLASEFGLSLSELTEAILDEIEHLDRLDSIAENN